MRAASALTDLAPGFPDPVHNSQNVFRALMAALACPASVQPFATSLVPPMSLSAEMAAVALTLLDHETPVWLDAPLAACQGVIDYLRFHTGAPVTAAPGEAAFALVMDPRTSLPLSAFAIGSNLYPDRSTTFVFAIDSFSQDQGACFEGPGIETRARLTCNPEPADLSALLARNETCFPCGNDIFFLGAQSVAAFPRSTRRGEA
jgi:alpha-D-ribose 1-methylphosphonate 5-triphosphate synthase subunit PhnH